MIAHLRYARYLLRHKWYVLVVGRRLRVPLWRLLLHDWSKFLPGEWFPYARYFYGPEPTGAPRGVSDRPNREANKRDAIRLRADRFHAAWLHHQNRNPHHWQFWILAGDDGSTTPLPMPDAVLREMIADWASAGRVITGRWEVHAWYQANRDTIRLHPETRARVQVLLDTLDLP